MAVDPFLDVGGRAALVTGAGQGVGRAIAVALAEHGAGTVAVNDIDPGRAEAVATEIRAGGHNAVPLPFDVSDFDAFGDAVRDLAGAHGPLGVLVNNAGNQGAGGRRPPARPFWEQTPDDWRPSLRVNLDGVTNGVRHAMAQMVEVRYGRIVTVISDAGRVGEGGGLEAYSAAKAGAAGLTRAMARVGGRFGVTANCISLGATRTPATAHLLEDDDVNRRMLSSYIVRRPGEPDDAAALVAYLAAEATSWLTGQTIPLNGGYSLTL